MQQAEVLFSPFVCACLYKHHKPRTDPEAVTIGLLCEACGVTTQATRDEAAVQVQFAVSWAWGFAARQGANHAIAGVSLDMIHTQAY